MSASLDGCDFGTLREETLGTPDDSCAVPLASFRSFVPIQLHPSPSSAVSWPDDGLIQDMRDGRQALEDEAVDRGG